MSDISHNDDFQLCKVWLVLSDKINETLEESIESLLWPKVLDDLRDAIPEDEFNMWLEPLHVEQPNKNELILLAPNQHVMQWVKNFLPNIKKTMSSLLNEASPNIQLKVGRKSTPGQAATAMPITINKPDPTNRPSISFGPANTLHTGNINPKFNFETFIEGNSNQLARAAALQVSENPGQAYNPLFLYGGVGLGKTHLIHALGNYILQHNPKAKVLYLHSERFVADMIKALQRNAMNEFKKYYREVDCLLIDDIQFFANKERSQEEFFSYI